MLLKNKSTTTTNNKKKQQTQRARLHTQPQIPIVFATAGNDLI